MDHRIRFALGMDSGEKMSGHVEADETIIGGKARNIRSSKPARRITTGGTDKTPVMGILERGKDGTSKIRTTVVPDRNRKHVEAGAAL